MDKKDDDIDDVIILKGLGQSMKWRMPPNTTRCPVNKCREAFENRSDLTIHYQEQHAPYMVLCEICQKPLTAPNIGIVLKHYCERHPNSGKPHNLIRSVRKSISGRPTENVSLIVQQFLVLFNPLVVNRKCKYSSETSTILFRSLVEMTVNATKKMI